MKRIIGLLTIVVAVATIASLGTGAGDSSDHYKVRAIFNNAFSVIPGEDVKIAGVKVGKISDLDVTPDQKAAVTLDITEPGFQDFRKDAECTIRPQSLIGEKFVECTPTQPRVSGAAEAPKLEKITSGDGEGEYLLPDTQTSRPVDIDLVGNITRLPYRQRLAIIINEFGTGLAGRGDDLRQVIRSADPGLRQTDKVLKILAEQDDVLAELARKSDVALAPVARERDSVADFVSQAAEVSEATAERRADLEKNIQRLPRTLQELRPTMERLGGLSDQAQPVLSDLGAEAPSINRLITQLGPFSRSATTSLTSLGDASVPGRVALKKSKGIIRDLRTFASTSKPLAKNLRALTTSLKNTGGVERFLDYVFYQVAAINGFDAVGHYLRAQLLVNTCSIYAIQPDISCASKFIPASTRRAAARNAPSAQQALESSAGGRRDPQLARAEAVLRGMSPAQALGKTGAKATAKGADKGSSATSGGSDAPLALPAQVLPGGGESAPAAKEAAPAAAAEPASSGAPAANATSALLDYLLGGGA